MSQEPEMVPESTWRRYHELGYFVQKRWGRGWTPVTELTNYEEAYLQYHTLAVNGSVYRLVKFSDDGRILVYHTNEWNPKE